jgi:hypothetical protein
VTNDNQVQSVSFIAITPLYGFICDADKLQIDSEFRIEKYDPAAMRPFFAVADAFLRSVSTIPPEYLLWQRPALDTATISESLTPRYVEEFGGVYSSPAAIQLIFFEPCISFFRQLRLFRSGRLRGGDTYVIVRWTHHEQEKWESLASHRCTRMTFDPFVPLTEATFCLNSGDVAPFNVARDRLQPILNSFKKQQPSLLTSLELALDLYAREDFGNMDVVNALTALEALLLNGSKTELTYRLSMRIAHLLGADATSRKALFDDMKDFYDLRSMVVHGSELKPNHAKLLERLDHLREVLRRTLLTVMALIMEGISKSELECLFDKIVLDEGKRREVQAKASAFLCAEKTPVKMVQ